MKWSLLYETWRQTRGCRREQWAWKKGDTWLSLAKWWTKLKTRKKRNGHSQWRGARDYKSTQFCCASITIISMRHLLKLPPLACTGKWYPQWTLRTLVSCLSSSKTAARAAIQSFHNGLVAYSDDIRPPASTLKICNSWCTRRQSAAGGHYRPSEPVTWGKDASTVRVSLWQLPGHSHKNGGLKRIAV